jgi:hypothetical protein
MIVKNWALIISCYVLTLFFIHTTSTCIVRLGDICNTLRYSNQYLLHNLGTNIWLQLGKILKHFFRKNQIGNGTNQHCDMQIQA